MNNPALQKVGQLQVKEAMPHIRILLVFKIGVFGNYSPEVLKLGKELLAVSLN